MIDQPADRLEGQLLTLGRVVATAAPPRHELVAIVERNRAHRTRVRRAAGALAAVVVVGTGALSFTVLDGGDRADLSIDPAAGPEVEGPTGVEDAQVADPEIGGDDGCDLAGPEAESESFPDDLAAVGDALEARFPSCFGGIARTGPSSADLWVVDLVPQVKAAAQEMLGPDFVLTALPSDHAMLDVKALKDQIDDDAAQLHTAGVPVAGTGVLNVAAGPRVLVGLSPYTREGAEQLEGLYGADWLLIEEYGEVIPG